MTVTDQIMSQFFVKRDDFNFSTINFPYLCSNIPPSYTCCVYISQLIRYLMTCSTYHQSLIWCSLLTTSCCYRGFYSLVYRQLSAYFTVIITIWFANTTFHEAKCCLMCFIPIIKRFLTLWSWPRIVHFTWSGTTASVTGRQWMITPPRHPMVWVFTVLNDCFLDMYAILSARALHSL
jgi:hypothetical protein